VTGVVPLAALTVDAEVAAPTAPDNAAPATTASTALAHSAGFRPSRNPLRVLTVIHTP